MTSLPTLHLQPWERRVLIEIVGGVRLTGGLPDPWALDVSTLRALLGPQGPDAPNCPDIDQPPGPNTWDVNWSPIVLQPAQINFALDVIVKILHASDVLVRRRLVLFHLHETLMHYHARALKVQEAQESQTRTEAAPTEDVHISSAADLPEAAQSELPEETPAAEDATLPADEVEIVPVEGGRFGVRRSS